MYSTSRELREKYIVDVFLRILFWNGNDIYHHCLQKKTLPRKSKFKQKKNAIRRLFEFATKKNVAIDPFELIESSVLS